MDACINALWALASNPYLHPLLKEWVWEALEYLVCE